MYLTVSIGRLGLHLVIPRISYFGSLLGDLSSIRLQRHEFFSISDVVKFSCCSGEELPQFKREKGKTTAVHSEKNYNECIRNSSGKFPAK